MIRWWLLLAAWGALVVSVWVLGGCRNPPVVVEGSAPPPVPVRLVPETYPTLCSDPDREATLRHYLQAWRDRGEAPDDLSASRSRILDLYSAAYREMRKPEADADFNGQLRLLWDLCGVAHSTMVPPAMIKGHVRWEEPDIPADIPARQVAAADATDHPVRARPTDLPGLTSRLLESAMADPAEGVSFADFVSANVRQVYLTPELVHWSPSCPLEVCGSSEPLTRTLILVSVGYVDLAPKPDWSLAKVAVHEAAHIEWFHRPEVSDDPRLLLPVPNERNAWRVTVEFLRGLVNARSPLARQYVQQRGTAIREALKRARQQVRRANGTLGLPEGDLGMCTRLPGGISEDALRSEGEPTDPQEE